MGTEIGEKIRVVCLFEGGWIKPILFEWRRRIYKILRTIFSYSKNIGKEKIFYFSVQAETGSFEISFNPERFWWKLERIY